MSIFSRKRSLIQAQKLLRRERARRWIKAVFIFVLFSGLLYGLSAVSYITKLNVQTVIVSGNSAIPTDAVLEIARNAVRDKKFFIFSGANILWYPKQQIINTLQYSYSWIDSISINRVSGTTVEIKIKERVPVAVWCGASQDKPTTCQLVDVLGYVFAKAPDFSGVAYLKLYGPLTSASWHGAGFFSQNGLIHMLEFAKALPEIGFQPISAEATSANTYNMSLDNGTYISVPISEPVAALVSNISSLLSQKDFSDSKTSNFSNLVYIDARFGNKLFYKFK